MPDARAPLAGLWADLARTCGQIERELDPRNKNAADHHSAASKEANRYASTDSSTGE